MANILGWQKSFPLEAIFEWSKVHKDWLMEFGFNELNPIEYNNKAMKGSIITN